MAMMMKCRTKCGGLLIPHSPATIECFLPWFCRSLFYLPSLHQILSGDKTRSHLLLVPCAPKQRDILKHKAEQTWRESRWQGQGNTSGTTFQWAEAGGIVPRKCTVKWGHRAAMMSRSSQPQLLVWLSSSHDRTYHKTSERYTDFFLL